MPRAAVAPFFALAVLYIAWTLYLKESIYPAGAREPYALTADPALLKLKLRYLAWLGNVPTQFARRGLLGVLATIAAAPALVWMTACFARAARSRARELLLCAAW